MTGRIPDVNKALLDGFSTSGGLGMGLPGARRLMDEFEISSEVKKGTVVESDEMARRGFRATREDSQGRVNG